MNRIIIQIIAAYRKAHEAFLSYRVAKPIQKITFLNAIADSIEQQRLKLSDIANQETSLPHARLEVEITRTINQLRIFSSMLKDNSWVRQNSH